MTWLEKADRFIEQLFLYVMKKPENWPSTFWRRAFLFTFPVSVFVRWMVIFFLYLFTFLWGVGRVSWGAIKEKIAKIWNGK